MNREFTLFIGGLLLGIFIVFTFLVAHIATDKAYAKETICFPRNVTGTFLQTEQPTTTVIYSNSDYQKMKGGQRP